MEGQWERGRQAMQQSLDLAKAGEAEQALNVLDSALAQATEENHGMWIAILCRHAAVFAHVYRPSPSPDSSMEEQSCSD